VHKFVCQGTIEERIDALIEEKKALATELLGSGRGGESLLMEMSNEALLDFVRLDISAAVG
jgi:non-specific serine/threonine protein kinase